MKTPRRPHEPARARCLDDLARELRHRHDRNRRRMWARRMFLTDDGAIPMVNQMAWRVAVARRWYRIFKQED